MKIQMYSMFIAFMMMVAVITGSPTKMGVEDSKMSADSIPIDLSENDSATVTLSEEVSERPVIAVGQVIVKPRLCRRYSAEQNFEPFVDENGKSKVDVGRCSGGCLQDIFGTKKDCQAVSYETVVLKHPNGYKREVQVIKECNCACLPQQCKPGYYWNHKTCRCEPRISIKPCLRSSRLAEIFGISVDVGYCSGDCEGPDRECKALTYEAESYESPIGYATINTVGSCGCASCLVKPKVIILNGNGRNEEVNVGTCDGFCGPEEWPQGANPSTYQTTQCQVAETVPLTTIGGNVVDRVTKCDCKPALPKCARLPYYRMVWDQNGGSQVVDVGQCSGRCLESDDPDLQMRCTPTETRQLCIGDATNQCSVLTVIDKCDCVTAG